MPKNKLWIKIFVDKIGKYHSKIILRGDSIFFLEFLEIYPQTIHSASRNKKFSIGKLSKKCSKQFMKKAGIIGNPIHHSKSPRLHNHWIQILGLNARYERIFSELDDFDQTIQTLKENGFSGLNVTIPFKKNAKQISQRQSNFVKLSGAANTLVFDKQSISAHNTDGFGFSKSIMDKYPNWNPCGEHVILGAGGAAVAIVAWLVKFGARKIHVVNRNQERAQKLKTLGDQIEVHDWNALPELLPNKTTLINTTSLGMDRKNDIDIDLSDADAEMIVYDIIYTPLKTNLLKLAEERDLRTLNGLDMLLWQARPGFKAWFGKNPPEIDQGLRNFMISNQVVALTGSMGSGKSTVSGFFKEQGFEIWSADEEVDRLYETDEELTEFIKQHDPDSIKPQFDKSKWRQFVISNRDVLAELEHLIHRKIRISRREFLESEATLKLCEIPLLFETQTQYLFDKTITVSAPRDVCVERALSRNKMSLEQINAILDKQMSDDEKRKKADIVINNGGSLLNTKTQVIEIIKSMGIDHA